jgi:cytochrome P450
MQLTPVDVNTIDLSDPEFWVTPREYRESAFWSLRREEPIKFFKEMTLLNFPPGPGYYALTKHEDIWAVSRNPELWCSGQGSNITTLTPELNEFFGSMINMDDPKHFRLRSIVSKGFTPKEISRVEEYVKQKAKTLVDEVLEQHSDDEFDFVEKLAAPFHWKSSAT